MLCCECFVFCLFFPFSNSSSIIHYNLFNFKKQALNYQKNLLSENKKGCPRVPQDSLLNSNRSLLFDPAYHDHTVDRFQFFRQRIGNRRIGFNDVVSVIVLLFIDGGGDVNAAFR